METAVLFYIQSLRMLSDSLQSEPGIGREIGRGYVRPRSSENLEELFARAERWQQEHGVEPLSEEEAMKLANEELHAMRRERRSAR